MTRALILSRLFPFEPRTDVYGAFKRLQAFVRAVAGLVSELDMLCFVPPNRDLSQSAQRAYEQIFADYFGSSANLFMAHCDVSNEVPTFWTEYLAGAFSFFRQRKFALTSSGSQAEALERCLARGPDWILAHRLSGAIPLLRTGVHLPPVFLDMDDVEHLALARWLLKTPFWTGERLKLLHLPALMLGESRALRLASKSFVCSDSDSAYLRRLYRGVKVVTIPNSLEFPEISPGGPTRPDVLFVGNYDHAPNAAAAEHMIRNIWPRIRARVPEARLLLAGAKPSRVPSFSTERQDVSFMGFVDDLAHLYGAVRVVCCPLLSGGGTRVKIIEAAAHGKAVVSTRIGAEGLLFEDGQEIVLRDAPEQFAVECVRLLRDAAMAETIGTRARNKAMRAYDRPSTERRIQAEILATLRERSWHGSDKRS